MQITPDLLRAVMPDAAERADLFAAPLATACARFAIDTEGRLAAFLAQIAVESGELWHLAENLNYSAEGLRKEWPLHFDPSQAALYAHNPQAIANRAYAGRNGNGDEQSGDGWKYRGRGLIQITGRRNYSRVADAIGLPLETQPELLEQPAPAALSGAWFWSDTGCNDPADRGDFAAVTRRIDGGLGDYAQRCEFWQRAQKALAVAPSVAAAPAATEQASS